MVVLALLQSGCSDTDLILDGGEGVHGIVHGEVRSLSGLPIAGASVAVFVFRSGDCSSGAESPGTTPPVTTRSDGTFSRVIIVPFTAPFEACIETEIVPPAGSGWSALVLSDLHLGFRPEGEDPDSLLIQAVLPSVGESGIVNSPEGF